MIIDDISDSSHSAVSAQGLLSLSLCILNSEIDFNFVIKNAEAKLWPSEVNAWKVDVDQHTQLQFYRLLYSSFVLNIMPNSVSTLSKIDLLLVN